MKDKDELMMQTMYWWGIPTLFRCEHNSNISECDIALVGVPHSSGNGTTERDQHLGPRAVRHDSAGLRRVHFDFQINPWEKKKIIDLGDVPLPEANNNEKCIESITNFYSKISDAKKPVVSIGGDHSITGGIIQGLAKEKKITLKSKLNFMPKHPIVRVMFFHIFFMVHGRNIYRFTRYGSSSGQPFFFIFPFVVYSKLEIKTFFCVVMYVVIYFIY